VLPLAAGATMTPPGEVVMTSFDSAALARRYAQEETDELVRIAYVESDEYLPEAVALAREELGRRGVAATLAQRVEVVREDKAARQNLADEPLDGGTKTFCFVLPSLVGAIIALVQDNRGRQRASRQAWAWTGLGFLMRTALVVGVIVIETLK